MKTIFQIFLFVYLITYGWFLADTSRLYVQTHNDWYVWQYYALKLLPLIVIIIYWTNRKKK